jgi:hypothetical protein
MEENEDRHRLLPKKWRPVSSREYGNPTGRHYAGQDYRIATGYVLAGREVLSAVT